MESFQVLCEVVLSRNYLLTTRDVATISCIAYVMSGRGMPIEIGAKPKALVACCTYERLCVGLQVLAALLQPYDNGKRADALTCIFHEH